MGLYEMACNNDMPQWAKSCLYDGAYALSKCFKARNNTDYQFYSGMNAHCTTLLIDVMGWDMSDISKAVRKIYKENY